MDVETMGKGVCGRDTTEGFTFFVEFANLVCKRSMNPTF